ncbi:hypothetical protein V5O48_012134 [Marasmius crinis-equi]|uniref:Uncharacterized protein n=1 Tax=Marasmius crinis-equi TaxID=585013 RepID=A0ABR3F403_9AGAR
MSSPSPSQPELRQLRTQLQSIHVLGFELDCPEPSHPRFSSRGYPKPKYDDKNNNNWLHHENIPGLRKLKDTIRVDLDVLDKNQKHPPPRRILRNRLLPHLRIRFRLFLLLPPNPPLNGPLPHRRLKTQPALPPCLTPFPLYPRRSYPRVTLRLTRLDPEAEEELNDERIASTIRELEGMGTKVELGERRLGEVLRVPVRVREKRREGMRMGKARGRVWQPTEKINLDLSALIALVSDLTHASLPMSIEEANRRFVPPQKYLEWKRKMTASKARARKMKTNGEIAAEIESGLGDEEGNGDGGMDEELPYHARQDLAKHSRALISQVLQEMGRGGRVKIIQDHRNGIQIRDERCFYGPWGTDTFCTDTTSHTIGCKTRWRKPVTQRQVMGTHATIEKKRSDEIYKQVTEDQKGMKGDCKILVLGSGKSTIVKQMRIEQENGLSESERLTYRPDLAVQASQTKILAISSEIADATHQSWQDSAVHQILAEQQDSLDLMDNAPYLLSDITRTGSPDYLLSEVDASRSYKMTREFTETDVRFKMSALSCVVGFTYNTTIYNNGFCQADYRRSRAETTERRKWIMIHDFEGVTSILFCTALSDYAKSPISDIDTTRLTSSRASSMFNFSMVPAYLVLIVSEQDTAMTAQNNIKVVHAAVKETILQNAIGSSKFLKNQSQEMPVTCPDNAEQPCHA